MKVLNLNYAPSINKVIKTLKQEYFNEYSNSLKYAQQHETAFYNTNIADIYN